MKTLNKLVITLLATFGFMYMFHILIDQQTRINELNKEIAYFNREIQEENLETEMLNDTITSMSTDAYIEEVARERLGLVMPSEIIFMDASL